MDISSLRERSDMPLTVTEVNGLVKTLLDGSRILSSVNIKGEISNFVNHRSGHLYFSLKDGESQIKAVMFASSAMRLRFKPENGMKVTVFGSVKAFVRDGVYQVYVTSMQPDGIGALYLAYEQLKARLAGEGLFSPLAKKPIPKFPKRIGIITSPTGAAIRDILNVTGRRFPLCDIYVFPALVQGDGAEATLIKGIDYFDRSGLVDTVIIGRGGGSIEDLWAFNSEALARRIYECRVPVISAVGHETDFTICDFVADLRAPTPSAAAELAVPDISEILLRLDGLSDRCDASVRGMLLSADDCIRSLEARISRSSPERLLSLAGDKVKALADRSSRAYQSRLKADRLRLGKAVSHLEALSPLAVLSRGYSVTVRDGKAVSSTSDISVGDKIDIRLSDGTVNVICEKISPTEGSI